MPRFSFTDFRHDARHWIRNGEAVETHTLELTGEEESGGVNKAILIFDSGPDLGRARAGGTVGYMTRNEGGTSLVGWLPIEEFSSYLNILACGEPLSVHFVLRDPRAGVGYVRRLGIGHYEKILAATICRPSTVRRERSAEVIPLPV